MWTSKLNMMNEISHSPSEFIHFCCSSQFECFQQVLSHFIVQYKIRKYIIVRKNVLKYIWESIEYRHKVCSQKLLKIMVFWVDIMKVNVSEVNTFTSITSTWKCCSVDETIVKNTIYYVEKIRYFINLSKQFQLNYVIRRKD